MNISYNDTKQLDSEDLRDLFLSVEWDSGNHPEKLTKAIHGSHSVFTAWDNSTLVGLINVLSDGHMAAYIHYLLVRPEYQSKGIGQALIAQMTEAYSDVAVKVLISYESAAGFYERCGFDKGADKSPMFLTELNV